MSKLQQVVSIIWNFFPMVNLRFWGALNLVKLVKTKSDHQYDCELLVSKTNITDNRSRKFLFSSYFQHRNCK